MAVAADTIVDKRDSADLINMELLLSLFVQLSTTRKLLPEIGQILDISSCSITGPDKEERIIAGGVALKVERSLIQMKKLLNVDIS